MRSNDEAKPCTRSTGTSAIRAGYPGEIRAGQPGASPVALRVVSRRIEIELTSARPDGSWTWRAAGAREPRGVLDGSLLHSGAKAGDVLRAEADFELEGITIISVLAPKSDTRAEPARIEVVGPGRPEGPGVTTQLVGRSDRRSGDRRRDRDDGRPRRDDGRPRRDRDQGRPQTGRDTGRPRREGAEETAEPSTGAGGRRGPGERRDRERTDRPARSDAASEHESGSSRRRRDRVPAAPAPAEADADRRKPRRLNPGTAHRRAVMESLAPEERPIAEQVLRGGIPAVRTALHLEREKATAEGRPAPNTDELIAMAERLLPRLKAAEWRDRAEAAAAAADEISLRDLRSVVAGADVARDDETRALATKVREALERRVTATHEEWSGEIVKQLDDGRVVRALRLSARPPDPAARLDAELSQRLTDAAGAAMSPDAPPDRWAALLDAAAVSPVRRSIQPVGLPENAPPDLKRSAHQHSGSIPALAKLLGVSIPPPPVPSGSRRRPDPSPAAGRRSKPSHRRGGSSGAEHDQGSAGRSRASEPDRVPGSAVPERDVPECAVPEPGVPEREVREPEASAPEVSEPDARAAHDRGSEGGESRADPSGGGAALEGPPAAPVPEAASTEAAASENVAPEAAGTEPEAAGTETVASEGAASTTPAPATPAAEAVEREAAGSAPAGDEPVESTVERHGEPVEDPIS